MVLRLGGFFSSLRFALLNKKEQQNGDGLSQTYQQQLKI